jgi:iron complex transport system ATP-binding protein
MELQAKHVQVRLGKRLALDDLSCQFVQGWTAIVGPNGAGKSTLLRCLAGLTQPSAGSIELDGQPLMHWQRSLRARTLVWLPQTVEASEQLTVREIVALGRIPYVGLLAPLQAHDHAVIDQAMRTTECLQWENRLLQELSGGERQRVLIARALATQAQVLLFDEPTTHVDAPHQLALVRLFRTLAQSHTVITVLHDLNLALAADHLVLLGNGKLTAQGRVHDLQMHGAIADAFDHAVSIHQISAQWVVVPALHYESTDR